MDTEQRLRQLTAEFPGTPPPDAASIAAVVRRGKRRVQLHRAGLVSTVVGAAALAVAIVGPSIDRPTPPVIAPVVDERPLPGDADPSPPAPRATERGGVDDEVLEALPVVDDLPAPSASPSEPPAAAPAEVASRPEPSATVEVSPQPSASPEPVAGPEPSATPSAEPSATPSQEPTAEPGPSEPAPFEGFTLSVSTDAPEYAHGAHPQITIRACNTTQQVREQQHAQTGHRFDLWIRNTDTGDWVADTTDRVYDQAVETVRWEPGQCRAFTEVWHGTFGPIGDPDGAAVPSGPYQAKVKWVGTEAGQSMTYAFSPTFDLAGSSSKAPFEGFTITLTTDRASYGYEEQVTFKIRACNTSGEAREQVIPHAGHVFDLYVRNADGQVVADTTWRSYDGPTSTIAFPAGGCETWLETWWQCEGQVHSEPTGAHLPAGTYTAKIAWLGTEQTQEYGWVQSAPFELTG